MKEHLVDPKDPVLPTDIGSTVSRALAEDIGEGDITARLIPETISASAAIITREAAVLCGTAWATEALRQIDPDAAIEWLAKDGDLLSAEQPLAYLQGAARSLLTAERTMLNFLQTLSGTASLSRHYADRVARTPVRLLDTRKTLPGLRTAQKYAVRVGGCFNHRMGLFDAFLIKENHVSACGSILAAVNRARQVAAGKPIEVEVENFAELEEALNAGADIIMLDDFKLEDISKAVEINRRHKNRCRLEASGGISQESLIEVAETGVDFISIGALTKNVRAIDLSMRLTHLP
jgi:nicotinate-nucleotide pyrophosphorylase (carboxylating)